LASAVAGASGRWSEEGESGPRAIVEATLRSEVDRASQAAALLGGNPVAARDLTLSSAEDAATALRELGPEVDKRFSWAEDRDLSKASGGTTLEQLMMTHANDLAASAQRLRGS
jgi:hypothetical protein